MEFLIAVTLVVGVFSLLVGLVGLGIEFCDRIVQKNRMKKKYKKYKKRLDK